MILYNRKYTFSFNEQTATKDVEDEWDNLCDMLEVRNIKV